MKINKIYALIVGSVLVLGGCSTSKKTLETTPIDTYVMPCTDLKSGDGIIRAWASGSSDNEMTARKKAQASASAELAAILEKTVKSTTEDYTTALSEGLSSESKSFFSEKTQIVVNQTLKGATIVCDRWNKNEENGQYTNYIVLELKGEEYLMKLFDELKNNNITSIDKELLKKLFLKQIDSIDRD